MKHMQLIAVLVQAQKMRTRSQTWQISSSPRLGPHSTKVTRAWSSIDTSCTTRITLRIQMLMWNFGRRRNQVPEPAIAAILVFFWHLDLCIPSMFPCLAHTWGMPHKYFLPNIEDSPRAYFTSVRNLTQAACRSFKWTAVLIYLNANSSYS